MEEKARKLDRELDLNEKLATTAKKEADALRQENVQLKKDVEWLANSAKNNKLQADRAIAELEAYTQILRGMEKKLAETEIERESKEAELRELRQKIMFMGVISTNNQV
jgi:chromosome segregation ATPase